MCVLLFFLLFFGPFGSLLKRLTRHIILLFVENDIGTVCACVCFIVISPVGFQYKQSFVRKFVFAFLLSKCLGIKYIHHGRQTPTHTMQWS